MSQYGPQTKGQMTSWSGICGSFIFGDLNHNHFKYLEQHIRMLFIREMQSSNSESTFTSLHILFGCPVMAVKPWWKRSANNCTAQKIHTLQSSVSTSLLIMLCIIHCQTGAFSALCLLFSSCCSQIKKNRLPFN